MLRCLGVLTVVFVIGAAAARAASPEDEARVYLDKATAAYALNKYAVAAENFEKAFELKPDPALLYNAAQSHRLAGNKQRALELYESYLRVYGKGSGTQQIESRIRELKQAIEQDRSVATSPPTTTLPVGGGSGEPATGAPPAAGTPPPATPNTVEPAPPPPAALPAAPPPADTTSSTPTMLTQTGGAPATDDRPLTRRPLFWVGVGGAVVATTVVILLLASGGSDPAMPSLGRVPGN